MSVQQPDLISGYHEYTTMLGDLAYIKSGGKVDEHGNRITTTWLGRIFRRLFR